MRQHVQIIAGKRRSANGGKLEVDKDRTAMTTEEGPWTAEEKAVLDEQKKSNAKWHKENRESGRNKPHWSCRKAASDNVDGDQPQEVLEEAWNYLFSATPETATQCKKQRKKQFLMLMGAFKLSKRESDRARRQQLSAAAIRARREREANRPLLFNHREMIRRLAASRRTRAAALEPLRFRDRWANVSILLGGERFAASEFGLDESHRTFGQAEWQICHALGSRRFRIVVQGKHFRPGDLIHPNLTIQVTPRALGGVPPVNSVESPVKVSRGRSEHVSIKQGSGGNEDIMNGLQHELEPVRLLTSELLRLLASDSPPKVALGAADVLRRILALPSSNSITVKKIAVLTRLVLSKEPNFSPEFLCAALQPLHGACAPNASCSDIEIAIKKCRTRLFGFSAADVSVTKAPAESRAAEAEHAEVWTAGNFTVINVVGVETSRVDAESKPPVLQVICLDVSGSMDQPEKGQIIRNGRTVTETKTRYRFLADGLNQYHLENEADELEDATTNVRYLVLCVSSQCHVLVDGVWTKAFNITQFPLMQDVKTFEGAAELMASAVRDECPQIPLHMPRTGNTPAAHMIESPALVANFMASRLGYALNFMMAFDGKPYGFPDLSVWHPDVYDKLKSKEVFASSKMAAPYFGHHLSNESHYRSEMCLDAAGKPELAKDKDGDLKLVPCTNDEVIAQLIENLNYMKFLKTLKILTFGSSADNSKFCNKIDEIGKALGPDSNLVCSMDYCYVDQLSQAIESFMAIPDVPMDVKCSGGQGHSGFSSTGFCFSVPKGTELIAGVRVQRVMPNSLSPLLERIVNYLPKQNDLERIMNADKATDAPFLEQRSKTFVRARTALVRASFNAQSAGDLQVVSAAQRMVDGFLQCIDRKLEVLNSNGSAQYVVNADSAKKATATLMHMAGLMSSKEKKRAKRTQEVMSTQGTTTLPEQSCSFDIKRNENGDEFPVVRISTNGERAERRIQYLCVTDSISNPGQSGEASEHEFLDVVSLDPFRPKNNPPRFESTDSDSDTLSGETLVCLCHSHTFMVVDEELNHCAICGPHRSCSTYKYVEIADIVEEMSPSKMPAIDHGANLAVTFEGHLDVPTKHTPAMMFHPILRDESIPKLHVLSMTAQSAADFDCNERDVVGVVPFVVAEPGASVTSMPEAIINGVKHFNNPNVLVARLFVSPHHTLDAISDSENPAACLAVSLLVTTMMTRGYNYTSDSITPSAVLNSNKHVSNWDPALLLRFGLSVSPGECASVCEEKAVIRLVDMVNKALVKFPGQLRCDLEHEAGRLCGVPDAAREGAYSPGLTQSHLSGLISWLALVITCAREHVCGKDGSSFESLFGLARPMLSNMLAIAPLANALREAFEDATEFGSISPAVVAGFQGICEVVPKTECSFEFALQVLKHLGERCATNAIRSATIMPKVNISMRTPIEYGDLYSGRLLALCDIESGSELNATPQSGIVTHTIVVAGPENSGKTKLFEAFRYAAKGEIHLADKIFAEQFLSGSSKPVEMIVPLHTLSQGCEGSLLVRALPGSNALPKLPAPLKKKEDDVAKLAVMLTVSGNQASPAVIMPFINDFLAQGGNGIICVVITHSDLLDRSSNQTNDIHVRLHEALERAGFELSSTGWCKPGDESSGMRVIGPFFHGFDIEPGQFNTRATDESGRYNLLKKGHEDADASTVEAKRWLQFFFSEAALKVKEASIAYNKMVSNAMMAPALKQMRIEANTGATRDFPKKVMTGLQGLGVKPDSKERGPSVIDLIQRITLALKKCPSHFTTIDAPFSCLDVQPKGHCLPFDELDLEPNAQSPRLDTTTKAFLLHKGSPLHTKLIKRGGQHATDEKPVPLSLIAPFKVTDSDSETFPAFLIAMRNRHHADFPKSRERTVVIFLRIPHLLPPNSFDLRSIRKMGIIAPGSVAFKHTKTITVTVDKLFNHLLYEQSPVQLNYGQYGKSDGPAVRNVTALLVEVKSIFSADGEEINPIRSIEELKSASNLDGFEYGNLFLKRVADGSKNFIFFCCSDEVIQKGMVAVYLSGGADAVRDLKRRLKSSNHLCWRGLRKGYKITFEISRSVVMPRGQPIKISALNLSVLSSLGSDMLSAPLRDVEEAIPRAKAVEMGICTAAHV